MSFRTNLSRLADQGFCLVCEGFGCKRISADNACEYFPGVNVRPRPEPDPRNLVEWNKWNEEYAQWGNVKCPCGKGYYCRRHGQWITGKEIDSGEAAPRELQQDGQCPPSHDNSYSQGGEEYDDEEPNDLQVTDISSSSKHKHRSGDASSRSSRHKKHTSSESKRQSREKSSKSSKSSKNKPKEYRSSTNERNASGSYDQDTQDAESTYLARDRAWTDYYDNRGADASTSYYDTSETQYSTSLLANAMGDMALDDASSTPNFSQGYYSQDIGHDHIYSTQNSQTSQTNTVISQDYVQSAEESQAYDFQDSGQSHTYSTHSMQAYPYEYQTQDPASGQTYSDYHNQMAYHPGQDLDPAQTYPDYQYQAGYYSGQNPESVQTYPNYQVSAAYYYEGQEGGSMAYPATVSYQQEEEGEAESVSRRNETQTKKHRRSSKRHS